MPKKLFYYSYFCIRSIILQSGKSEPLQLQGQGTSSPHHSPLILHENLSNCDPFHKWKDRKGIIAKQGEPENRDSRLYGLYYQDILPNEYPNNKACKSEIFVLVPGKCCFLFNDLSYIRKANQLSQFPKFPFPAHSFVFNLRFS